MRPLAATLITSAIFALLASGASAATTCLAPPGQGAIDQYCELVPAAGGDRPSTPAPRARDVLAPATSTALRRAGSDGRAVALLAQTSPAPAGAASRRAPRRIERAARRKAPRAVGAVPVVAPKGTVEALSGDLLGGSPGSTWVRWALLGLTLGCVAGWLYKRRRPPAP